MADGLDEASPQPKLEAEDENLKTKIRKWTKTAANGVVTLMSVFPFKSLKVDGQGLPPSIIKDPWGNRVSIGGPAIFTCTVDGEPAPSIEWIHNGSPVSQSERITISRDNNKSKLNLLEVAEEDEGEYYCRASNSAGETKSTTVSLHIMKRTPPSIIKDPWGNRVSIGGLAIFTCTVHGEPAPSIEWIHNGSPVSQSVRITISRNNNKSILNLLEVTEEDKGEYYCRASNSAGETKSTTVSLHIMKCIPPSIIKDPWDNSVSIGGPAVFTCTAHGEPAPFIEWIHNGSPVSPSERIIISRANDKSILTLMKAAEEDKGEYYCRASNSAGETKSTTASLHIECIPPSIIKHPQSTSVPTGKPAIFTCTVHGESFPSIEWIHNGSPVSQSERITISRDNNKSILTLMKAAEEDEGEYYCRASNSAGETKSTTASLHIEPTQVEAVIETFKITKDKMKGIVANLTECFKKGLERDGEVLKMLPTYVHSLPANEEGDFLALDFGGSTLRVVLATIKSGEITQKEEKYEMESYLKESTQEKLFDFIAECLSSFVKQYKITKKLPLGFTFSFPVHQTSLTSGTLLQWTKGFNVSGAVDQDVVKLLREGLQRRGDVEIDVVALLNDTTGTQMSVGLYDPDCHVGLILGTGFNTCYMEKLDAVKKLSGNHTHYSTMIINTELCAFGDDGKLEPWLTEFDRELNSHSVHPGQQTYEKMVSYRYLGEIARLAMHKLIQNGVLFKGKSSDKFDMINAFETDYVITIAQEDDAECQRIFKDEFGIDATDADCKVVRRVCDAVTERAARLAGAAVVALVKKIDKTHCCTVAVDGSLYKKCPNFSAKMQRAMDELHPGNRIVMKVSEDGSGRGAAVVAAVATRLKVPIPPLWKPVAALGDQPTMPKLMAFESKKGPVYNILERIGSKYSALGIHLLQDNDGSIVSQLEQQYQLNGPRINNAILMSWLQGKGEQPTTWETLIAVLKNKIKLINLATDIEESLL